MNKRILILTINGETQPDIFTTLSHLCKRFGLKYNSISKKKFIDDQMKWSSGATTYVVTNATLNRVSSRLSNLKSTKNKSNKFLVGNHYEPF